MPFGGTQGKLLRPNHGGHGARRSVALIGAAIARSILTERRIRGAAASGSPTSHPECHFLQARFWTSCETLDDALRMISSFITH